MYKHIKFKMSKKTIIHLLIFLISHNILLAHKGLVYVDTNQNGKYDKGEKLLKGIMVSDGLNVIRTNADGSFNLPGHERERFIFITTPSGYMTDNAHYQKIDKSTSKYEFGLTELKGRIRDDKSHSFIQISDTEIRTIEGHSDWANNIRDYAANENITFIIHTGDICYESGMQAHIKLMNAATMNCPVFYCIGNHDLVKGEYGEALFENIYGPVYYSFDFGNIHYIVTPMSYGDYKPEYTTKDVYKWLKNDLAMVGKDTPIIFFNHDLLSHNEEFIFGPNKTEYLDLNDYNLKAWLYGHWHINLVRQQGKVKTISTSTLDKGGIDHSTSAFRVVSVDKDAKVETQLHYTYLKNKIAIASIAKSTTPMLNNGKTPISINTYSSTTRAIKVTCNLSADNTTFVKEVVLKQNTDWNWSTEITIPKSYIGKHIFMEATTIFSNGEIIKTNESFIYTPNQQTTITPTGNWTNLLGNAQHIGISKDTPTGTPQLIWVTNIKANLFMSSPIVADGIVYVAAVDEDLRGEAGIYALDAKNGNILWRYSTRNSIKNSIAYESGYILAQDAEGYLYAVNAKTRKLAWEVKLNTAGLPATVEGLSAYNGVVYAGSGKGFAAHDVKTGKQIWSNTSWEQGEGTTSTISADKDVVITGVQWRGVYGHDAATGKFLWLEKRDGLSDRGSTPAIHGDLLYLISRKSIFILNKYTGAIILKKDLNINVDVTSTPLVTNKLIIFGSNNGIVALDKETMKQKWVKATSPALIYTSPYTRYPMSTIETSPILVGDKIYIGASDGTLYGLDLNTGNTIWQHNVGAPVFSSMAASGNGLFVTDFGGNVYGFGIGI